jgi:AcrR family transcriptional regulator
MRTTTATAKAPAPSAHAAPPDRSRRGRPRSERRRAAVLDATLDELAQRGIRSMTIESVAERAGVSKVTIYRWWPDKVALTLDALQRLPELVVPDTGRLEGDLRELRVRLVELVETTRLGGVLPALVAERNRSEHHDAISGYIRERSQPFRDIVDRAVARGELPRHVDPDLIAHLFASPLSGSMLLRDTPLDDDEWGLTIRVVVAGLHEEAHGR